MKKVLFASMMALCAAIGIARVAKAEIANLPYFHTETMRFHDERVQPVIIDQLLRGAHPLPEVNARFAFLNEKVQNGFKAGLTVLMNHNFDELGDQVLEKSYIDGQGHPTFQVILPAHIDRWNRYLAAQDTRARERLDNGFIIGALHEVDHLMLDATAPLPVTLSMREKSIVGEIQAWAETCEHTVRHFVARSMPLPEDVQYYCEAWVRFGRSVESPEWKSFMRGIHTPVFR